MNPASDGALLRAVVDTNVYISAFLYPQRAIFQSGDRHLRRLKIYQGIPIVRPIDFLRTLGIT